MIAAAGLLGLLVAQAAPIRPDDATGPVFAFSAGGNAHQAGIAYALLSHYRRKDSPDAAGAVGAVSGVSSGGANALLSAVSWFLPDGADDRFLPEQNPLWNGWRAVSWTGLFPGDARCTEYRSAHPELDAQCTDDRPYRPNDGILTVNGFGALRAQLLKLFSMGGGFRRNARPIGVIINLTSETPVTVRSETSDGAATSKAARKTLDLPTSRRYLSVKLQTDDAGNVQVCDWIPVVEHSERRISLPLARPYRPEDAGAACRPVSTEALVDAVVASSAIPPLLPPQRVRHCAATCQEAATGENAFCADGQHLCQGRFADGALFDRFPVSDAAHLLPHASRYFLLESTPPFPERPAPSQQPTSPPAPLRGVRFYADAAAKFIDVGYDYELQTIDRYLPGVRARVERVWPRSPVFNHYLNHFAPLLHRRFAYYDYLTGIYEGVRWSAKLQCLELDEAAAQACAAQTDLARVLRFFGSELLEAGAARNHPRIPLRESRPLVFLILDDLWAEACAAGAKAPPEGQCKQVEDALDRLLGHGSGSDQAAAPSGDLEEMLKLRAYRGILTRTGGPAEEDTASFAGVALALDRARPRLVTDDMPFVQDFAGWRDETVRQMGSRLEAIERSEGRTGSAFILSLGEYGAMINRTRVARGLYFGSLSVPSRMAGSAFLSGAVGTLLPYSWEPDYGNGGSRVTWDVLSCRRVGLLTCHNPSWYAPILTLGAAMHWFRSDHQVVAGPTLMASWLLRWPILSEVGLQLWWHPAGDPSPTAMGADLVLRPLYGRLQASVGVRDLTCTVEHPCRYGVFATLGLGDLGSTLYWAFRGLVGD